MAHMLRSSITVVALCLFVLMGSLNEAFAQDAGQSEITSYELSSASPNPFTTQTAFQLTIAEPQRVSVAVFNMLGQRVALLFDGAVTAASERTFTFRSNNLPSGIYLVRVKGELFTASRQVTLLQ